MSDLQMWIFGSSLIGGLIGAFVSARVDRHFWRTYRYCPTCDRLGDER